MMGTVPNRSSGLIRPAGSAANAKVNQPALPPCRIWIRSNGNDRGDNMVEEGPIPAASSWYVTTLVICSRLENEGARLRTCDEQIRLLRASDSETAYEKAIQLGKAEEVAYQNTYGQTVHWEFVGLVDLEELPSETIEDGVEIKSRLFRSKNPTHLARSKDELTVFRWEQERRQREQVPERGDQPKIHEEERS